MLFLSAVELDQCSAALRFVINIGQRVDSFVDAAEFRDGLFQFRGPVIDS